MFKARIYLELLLEIWNLLKFFLLIGGLAYGISYLSDISGSLKVYKKAYQDSRKRIDELESYLRINQENSHSKGLDDILDDADRTVESQPLIIRELRFSISHLIDILNKEKPNLEYNSPTHLKKYALIYHEKFDFNISCISSEINQYNRNDNVLKAPNHEWVELQNNRQTKSEINNYDWHKATGLGIILGYNNIRALDIDYCLDFSLVDIFLKELELPDDYEWVIKSGSEKGFHILFYCDDYEQAHDGYGRVSYMSKKDFNFRKIDLMWDGHLVLPPTIHKENNNYTFMYFDTRIAFFEDKIPKYRPKIVDKKNVDNLLAIITDFKRIYPSF